MMHWCPSLAGTLILVHVVVGAPKVGMLALYLYADFLPDIAQAAVVARHGVVLVQRTDDLFADGAGDIVGERGNDVGFGFDPHGRFLKGAVGCSDSEKERPERARQATYIS